MRYLSIKTSPVRCYRGHHASDVRTPQEYSFGIFNALGYLPHDLSLPAPEVALALSNNRRLSGASSYVSSAQALIEFFVLMSNTVQAVRLLDIPARSHSQLSPPLIAHIE